MGAEARVQNPSFLDTLSVSVNKFSLARNTPFQQRSSVPSVNKLMPPKLKTDNRKQRLLSPLVSTLMRSALRSRVGLA